MASWGEAEDLPRVPLIVVDPLRDHLHDLGVGAREITVTRLGDGHSNETFSIGLDAAGQFVLRRPPRPPFPRSAHDVVREARLINALSRAGARVPRIVDICEDKSVIGAPFSLMEHVDGHVMSTHLPAEFADPEHHERIATELIDALAEIHAIDISSPALAPFVRKTAGGYLERQVARFSGLWERTATREVPEMNQVGEWLRSNLPQRSTTTVVHGDFRLGNVVFSRSAPPRLVAILDWEMGTLGDPLADLGYLISSWGRPDDEPGHPVRALSAATRAPSFPTIRQLGDLYEARTGRSTDGLVWYEVLAIWKAATFFEGSYRRSLAGSTDDPYFAALEHGVPALAREAAQLTE